MILVSIYTENIYAKFIITYLSNKKSDLFHKISGHVVFSITGLRQLLERLNKLLVNEMSKIKLTSIVMLFFI